MEKKEITILWTSGWDSTYRLIELSRMRGITVQPVYITGMGRKSQNNEIKAQKEILELLSKREETVAIIKQVNYIDAGDILFDEKITNAYDEIHKSIDLGIQYETLSQFAATKDLVEIGSEGGEEGTMRMTEAIQKCGGLIKQDDTFVLNTKTATSSGIYAFGHFSFPIIDKSECEMLENIKKWGYEDIMAHIWFCHTPTKDGIPCGVCRACEVKMMNHMEWLLPQKAQKRFAVKQFIWKLFGKRVANGICRRLYQR